MRFIYGKNDWTDLKRGEEHCFLLTNGLGGFSSLTAIASNARNDHALLIAAEEPPSRRIHFLSNVHAKLFLKEKEYDLASQGYLEKERNQEGFRYLDCFVYEYFPKWYYRVEDIELEQTILLRQNEDTLVIRYKITSKRNAELELVPWMQFVAKGSVLSKEQEFRFDREKIESEGRCLYYKTNGKADECPVEYRENWYYSQDERDGREYLGRTVKNHRIRYQITVGKQEFYVVYSTKKLPEISLDWIKKSFAQERERQDYLIKKADLKSPEAQCLVKSADQFLSWRNSTKSKTMIAGYPFFGDWGRDTVIAVAGCCLSTGQMENARSILRTFKKYCKRGLLPNMFPENGTPPIYNTVDASLLFIEAFYLYYCKTEDSLFLAEVWPMLKEIIHWYEKGTAYGIFMDEDGLIEEGTGKYQLTWMDVRVGDFLPTPRHGKPVEINAYWYNALKIMEELAVLQNDDWEVYEELAEHTKKNFLKKFWNEKGYLKDVLGNPEEENQIRCNQIWALTLSYTMVGQKQAEKIIETVTKHLYTPWGLRSLSKEDPAFQPVYGGKQEKRDLAYHQGTVWAYPLGAYYRAILRFSKNKKEAIREIREKLYPLEACLREGCIGQIAEIYDGEIPNISRGCFAQAWSVGELLRVYEVLEEEERG